MTLITTIIFILQIIVFAGILIYILLFSLFFIGWFNQKPFIPQAPTHGLFVSIIICFRNEETNLPELLTCLKKQQFDQTQFELILIDDHSTDSSFKLAKEFSKTWEIINIYQLPVNIEGKKMGCD